MGPTSGMHLARHCWGGGSPRFRQKAPHRKSQQRGCGPSYNTQSLWTRSGLPGPFAHIRLRHLVLRQFHPIWGGQLRGEEVRRRRESPRVEECFQERSLRTRGLPRLRLRAEGSGPRVAALRRSGTLALSLFCGSMWSAVVPCHDLRCQIRGPAQTAEARRLHSEQGTRR